jgi:hypothetical protein
MDESLESGGWGGGGGIRKGTVSRAFGDCFESIVIC